ncbi:hypothetical protein [Herbidospora cretacea]|uniref:hypothetical protein n=1 Tax=Herbidospora cretacea TaxID=28444 RepID=UPI0007740959|nr:hypothetical protein [Herbidospora cretacea]
MALLMALCAGLCLPALLITAADAWLTALVGLPPLIPALCRVARQIAHEYRMWLMGVVEADIVFDPNEPERTVWR